MRELSLKLTEAEYQLLGHPNQPLTLQELLSRLSRPEPESESFSASILLSLLQARTGLARPAAEFLDELSESAIHERLYI